MDCTQVSLAEMTTQHETLNFGRDGSATAQVGGACVTTRENRRALSRPCCCRAAQPHRVKANPQIHTRRAASSPRAFSRKKVYEATAFLKATRVVRVSPPNHTGIMSRNTIS